jgi:hypothetical protein
LEGNAADPVNVEIMVENVVVPQNTVRPVSVANSETMVVQARVEVQASAVDLATASDVIMVLASVVVLLNKAVEIVVLVVSNAVGVTTEKDAITNVAVDPANNVREF